MKELTKIKWKNGAELCLAGFGATVFSYIDTIQSLSKKIKHLSYKTKNA